MAELNMFGHSTVFCHGINDYGAKFSEHSRHFLDQGVRLSHLWSLGARIDGRFTMNSIG